MPRAEMWDEAADRRLLDSIVRGYPIGMITVWKTGLPGSCYQVVDGVQRLRVITALHDETFVDIETRTVSVALGDPPDTWMPLSVVGDTIAYLQWLERVSLQPPLKRAANDTISRIENAVVPVCVITTLDFEIVEEVVSCLTTDPWSFWSVGRLSSSTTR